MLQQSGARAILLRGRLFGTTPTVLKIYTKTGDQGTSGLFNGERRLKSDAIFEALGATDELNSSLGLAREYCMQSGNGLTQFLDQVQFSLLSAGASVATPTTSSSTSRHLERVKFDPNGDLVKELEAEIDRLDTQLKPLTKFILPSGGLASAALHIARSTCRRAERRVVQLSGEDAADHTVAVYLNRLSDYLFTAARFAAQYDKKEELLFEPRKRVAAKDL